MCLLLETLSLLSLTICLISGKDFNFLASLLPLRVDVLTFKKCSTALTYVLLKSLSTLKLNSSSMLFYR